MVSTVQAVSPCGSGQVGPSCASTTVANDAAVGVLSGLHAGPVISAFVAAAVLLAAVVFCRWVVRRVGLFFDLAVSTVGQRDPGVRRVRSFRSSRGLADGGRGRSLVDADDREDDDEDDEEDDGTGANRRGVQGGLT